MWFLVPDNERRTHLEDLHDSRSRYFHNDQCVMSLFPRAAFTKCHKPGLWFKQQLFILLQRRGWKSKNQVLAGLVSSEGREKESVSCFSPSFWWFADHRWHSSACRYITFICVFIFSGNLPVCVCVEISFFFFFNKGHQSSWARVHPTPL